MNFYIMEDTKNIIFSYYEINDSHFKQLEVQDDENKHEKHIPKVEIKGNIIHVKIGDIMHPMTPEHYISLIFLETNLGGQFKHLSYTNKPVVDFVLSNNEEPVAVYEYCTLHGLWKTNIK